MAVTANDIMLDVQETYRGIPGVVSVSWPPPEQQDPVQGPSIWLDYGPTSYELGSLEYAYHTITATVVTPRGTSYPEEYMTVLGIGREAMVAFRGNTLVAGEAAVMTSAAVAKPVIVQYPDNPQLMVQCVVTMQLQTQEEVANQIAM